MQEIKFRGKGLDNQWYYGDLVHHSTGVAIKPDRDCEDYEDVDPNTVSQFWGYDFAGNEIYEGDSITGVIGNWGKIPNTTAIILPTTAYDSHMVYDAKHKDIDWLQTIKEPVAQY